MHYFATGLVSSVFVFAASWQVSLPEKIPEPAMVAMRSASVEDILQNLRRVRADISASERNAPSQSP